MTQVELLSSVTNTLLTTDGGRNLSLNEIDVGSRECVLAAQQFVLF